jgi:hypothetical protein
MNSAGFWRFATFGVLGVCAMVVAAIVQLDLVSSATSIQGNNLTAVKVVRESAHLTTNSNAYVNVPGASTMITVPAGKQALIVIRFAASSACSQSPPSSLFCKLRVMVGPTEASPVRTIAGDHVDTWDTIGNSETWSAAHAIERSVLKGPGTYNVRAQFRVSEVINSAVFILHGFHMTVERIIQ